MTKENILEHKIYKLEEIMHQKISEFRAKNPDFFNSLDTTYTIEFKNDNYFDQHKNIDNRGFYFVTRQGYGQYYEFLSCTYKNAIKKLKLILNELNECLISARVTNY
jgi:hypothetical protein